MPSLTIDGKPVTVAEGQTVIQAAEKLGVFVPRYCYHPGLSIAGNCRICLVEVAGVSKLQIACNTSATEGMAVATKSAKAKEGRQSVLEFLLANHPLDCPVCDQSGECDLQNFYMQIGLYDPRFRETKVKKKKAVVVGPHVMLDQERCILCSRCVRFTDEISQTGEFGIFNRGDKAQVALYPGESLDNKYSGNVVDICPVGALTDRDSRFKVRAWYLKSAPTVCDGCSKGCNIDMHFVLDRPHLNDGARVVRLKPRHNPDVNQWWMCDAGRYGFDWMDKGRLTTVRSQGREFSWDAAMDAIATALDGIRHSGSGSRIGVIASAKLTTEELFLIREIFSGDIKARVSAAVDSTPGSADDFLIKADKNPNTMGATLLGLSPGNPQGKMPDAAGIVQEARDGRLKALWVFGHDLAALFGEETLRELSHKLELFVFSGTNENPSASLAHWVLPSAAYVEKDGTFVNCDGRVQRIGKAFAPLGDSREDWRFLLDLAGRLGLKYAAQDPEQIFLELAKAVPSFAGLTYETIGLQGARLSL